jgi:hypothetical protein
MRTILAITIATACGIAFLLPPEAMAKEKTKIIHGGSLGGDVDFGRAISGKKGLNAVNVKQARQLAGHVSLLKRVKNGNNGSGTQGDFNLGRRLPSGSNNVLATIRTKKSYAEPKQKNERYGGTQFGGGGMQSLRKPKAQEQSIHDRSISPKSGSGGAPGKQKIVSPIDRNSGQATGRRVGRPTFSDIPLGR